MNQWCPENRKGNRAEYVKKFKKEEERKSFTILYCIEWCPLSVVKKLDEK